MANAAPIFSVWIAASVLFVLIVVGVKFVYEAKARKKAKQDKEKQ